MKLRRFVYFVMVVLLIMMFTACSQQEATDENADSTDTDTSQNSDATEDVSEETGPSDSGELGDYTVSILNHELTEDYEGNPAIRIYFDFTNNSEDTASFYISTAVKAFQNGIELEKGYSTVDDVEEDDNNLKDIKPGATLKCALVYILDDASSAVEVEVTELISWDDTMLVKTFDIAE